MTERPADALHLVQVAIVVRDLERTVASYIELLGWRPWRVYDFRRLAHTGTHVRGVPTPYAMRAAQARVGGIDFEVIEPLGPSPYQDFLDVRGEGLHHIQVRGEAPYAARRRLAGTLDVLLGGKVDIDDTSSLEYEYYDGTDELHLYVEATYGDRERLLTLKPTMILGAEDQPRGTPR